MAWRTRPTYSPAAAECIPVAPTGTPQPEIADMLPVGPTVSLMPLQVALMPLLGSLTLGKFPLGSPARDPAVGSFVIDHAPMLQAPFHGWTGYLPPATPEPRIGTSFTIGRSPIGYYKRPTHHTLLIYPSSTPGVPDTETELPT